MWTNSVFVIPLLIAVVALIWTAQTAHADPFPNIERGPDYTKQYLGLDSQGRPTYQLSSSPQRILVDNSWQDYRLTQSPSSVTLETANAGSLVFNKASCSYDLHDSGYLDELNPAKIKNISWTVKGKSAASSTWSNVSTINNAACNVTVQATESTVKIIGEKAAASGTFQIVLDYVPGHGIKETFRAYNNNPAWNNHNIGFTETFEVPRIIHFGKQTYDLANLNGTTLGRNWIENNQAKLVKLSDKIAYDFGIGFANLDNVRISWDGSVAKLSLNYLYPTQTVPYQTWFEVDPTFNSASTTQGRVYNDGSGVTNCASDTVGGADGTTFVEKYNAGNGCQIAWFEWNIAAIPTNSYIASAYFEWDQTGSTSWVESCNLYVYSNRPSTLTSQQRYDQGWTGTRGGSSSLCTSDGNDKQLTLNSTGISTIQSKVTSGAGWWGTAFQGTTATADATNRFFTMTAGQTRLNIVYVTTPPNPATNLTAESQARQVQFSWTQTNGTGVTTYYLGRSLDNSTWPSANKTSVGNVTSYLSSAVWRAGQLYYVNITATNGLNSTAAYSSFTMDTIPSAPTLTQPMTLINSTAFNATSVAGSSNGGDTVDDFGLRCEKNRTGGWQTLVSNSSIPVNRKYTVNGFWSSGDTVICQWRDGNDVGWSAWSNNATYPPRPNAVTDLAVVAVFQTTAQIMWSQPGLNGLALLGYQVNYTSPWGTPNTVIIVTNSSDVEYSISGLTPNTQYSFRVSAVTATGNNASGNIVNVATITEFSVGDIDLDDSNPLRMPIRFVQTDLNSTTTELEIIYDNEFELDCELYFQFAQDTQEYDNLNGTEYDDGNDSVIFYFNNASNEVITIDCIDSITNATGRYQFQQSDFPLLDLIDGFRDGTYGTQGQFGVIDLITLMAIIFGMIGFNRTNPSVGVILMFFIMGALAYFEIIQWYTLASGMVATILFAVIGATRKDD